MSTDYVSQWPEKIEDVPFSRENLLDLLAGKIPYIRIPGFVSKDIAKKFEDYFSTKVSPYLNVPGPTLLRLGVAQFEFQAFTEEEAKTRPSDVKEQYFDLARESWAIHQSVEEVCGNNIWQEVQAMISAALYDHNVRVASDGEDRGYFSGIIRSINDSTPIHCDWSPYDSRTEDWIVNQVLNQVVFNLYLTPFKGGRTEVHDVQWTPDAMRYRDPESYGYVEGITNGRATAKLTPSVGDLYFFNSRNMHQVFAVEKEDDRSLPDGRRQRLTMSSFFGQLPKVNGGKQGLIMWS
ncbi:hypothetical protein AMS68_003244 [Peltaster fructicola]|uniref:Prolyl 4-hydroxylase alpha subunit Fe(2+) 2OG dioxygenase domain-containing protein n=1 Tax=Peltaster fructicola TaxID=286661 RepID=A0A6H0XSI8_9PEZI|nr:hypothetical protein AMS68_003244 [Peltaster fructicola]